MNEHEQMISCQHSEADQLLFVCLSCGRVSFDPSWLIVGISFVFFAIEAGRCLL